MRTGSRRKRLLRLSIGKKRLREEVGDEIRLHLELKTKKLMAAGLSAEEAHDEALRRFGSVEEVIKQIEKLTNRRAATVKKMDFVDTLRQDLGFALRQLKKSPGFAAITVLTVALAIGSTTAIFSVVDGILLRPLAFDEPEELVTVWSDYSRRGLPLREWFSYPNFHDLREEVAAFEAVALYNGWGPTLTGSGEAEQLQGTQISRGMFSVVFSVEPALGRGFLPEEDVPGGPSVVLISHGLWQRAFGGDPGLVGTTILLSDVPYTVIGVMPEDFLPPFMTADVYGLLQMDMTAFLGGRGSARFRAVGRLAEGASIELARIQATELGVRLEREYPDSNTDIGYAIFPLQDDVVRGTSTALWVLLGAVGFVLLIACVNVANLLLARGTSRRAELAVRSALGAGKSRIWTQLLTESLVLAALGGAVGMVIAFAGTDLLVALAPQGTPRIAEVGVDGRILAFAGVITAMAGLLFGVLPALRASRTEPSGALREGGRTGDSGIGGSRARSALVVGQVALALMLLVGAGLLIRSFQNLNRVDLGFDPEGVLTLAYRLPPARYPDTDATRAFLLEMEDRLRALPGVESVGSTNTLPLANSNSDVGFIIEGRPLPEPGNENIVWFRRVTPSYFETLGLEVVAGRRFDSSDDQNGPRTVMINQTLAGRYFPDVNAVGQRLNINNPADPVWREVVGVVKDVRNFGIRRASRNAMYISHMQAPTGFMFVTLRTAGDPNALIPMVRTQVAAMDPSLAMARVLPMTDYIGFALAQDRFITMLLASFAGITLLLAVVGLYGVVSYGVTARLREMGVRIALGAGSSTIGAMVMRRSLSLVAGGLVVGALGAFGLLRLMEGLLFGVTTSDPLTYTSVALVLAAAAAIASAIPALRATRVDPIKVLKAE